MPLSLALSSPNVTELDNTVLEIIRFRDVSKIFLFKLITVEYLLEVLCVWNDDPKSVRNIIKR